jgi:hypothetical protein
MGMACEFKAKPATARRRLAALSDVIGIFMSGFEVLFSGFVV